jgi:hypothetical protein
LIRTMADHEGRFTKTLDMRCLTGRPVSMLTEELWGTVGNVAAFTRRSKTHRAVPHRDFPPASRSRISPPRMECDFMDVGNGGAAWDPYLAFIDQPNGIIGRAQYNSEAFEDDTITHVLYNLRRYSEYLVRTRNCISRIYPI